MRHFGTNDGHYLCIDPAPGRVILACTVTLFTSGEPSQIPDALHLGGSVLSTEGADKPGEKTGKKSRAPANVARRATLRLGG